MPDDTPQEETVELQQVGWAVLRPNRKPRCFDRKPGADAFAVGTKGRVVPTYIIPEADHAE